MFYDYFYIAFTNVMSRGLRSWLTMIGIFIGIAAVIALISVSQGLKDSINTQFSAIGADKLIILPKSAGFGPPGSNSVGTLGKDDLKLINRVKGVELSAGRLLKSAKVEFNNVELTTFATSLPHDKNAAELITSINTLTAEKGRLLKKEDKNKVVIGAEYNAKNLFKKKINVGNGILVNNKRFEIIGIAKRIGDPGRDRAIWMNEDDARELFKEPDNFAMIVSKVSSSENPSKVAQEIEKSIRRDRHEKEGKESFEVQTPEQLLESFNSILTVIQVVLIGIAAISLLVGGVGIMNTMYTAVLERTKEIGVMKAIGAKKRDILSIFVIESGMLGMAGGIIGVLIGIALSKIVEIAAEKAFGPSLIKAHISIELILGAIAFSFIIGVISGVVPARKASNLQPVEALRYE
jgi:putative ABC transport system permease protein